MSLHSLVSDFLEPYCTNKDIYNSYNDKLLSRCSKEEWLHLLYERSEVTRDLFRKNEILLKELEDDLQLPFTQEKALAYFDMISQMYLAGYDDARVMIQTCEKLSAYFEEVQDIEHLLPVYRIMGFEYILLFGEDIDELEVDVIVSYYKKIIAYKDHYFEIVDVESRRCYFTAYSNLISPLSYKSSRVREHVLDIFEEVFEFYTNPKVQELDGDNIGIRELFDQMCEDVFYIVLGIIGYENVDQNRLQRIAHDVLCYMEERNSENHVIEHTKTLAKIIVGDLDNKEAIEYFTKYIENLRLPDYTSEDLETEKELVIDYHDSSEILFLLIGMQMLSTEEEKYYVNRFLPKLTGVFYHIPYSFDTAYVNYISSEWYNNMVVYLPSIYEKMEYIEQMVIIRQPFTYIHSLMVAKIAETISAVIIDEKPELFTTLQNYETIKKVRTWRRQLLGYIYHCGILHDVGKCGLVETINQQSRKISDIEFGAIRGHSAGALRFIKEDPAFARYFDVMLGHHKFYNGKGGYPASFDNTQSPIRILIDIITIADCMDAALDYLGRNYAKAKTFEQLMEELQRDAGVRYNPVLVELISENKCLREKLQYITGEGRESIYYGVYEKLMNIEIPTVD